MFDSAIVGGKGAKLAEMGSLGFPIPFGVTIPTDRCVHYFSLESPISKQIFIDSLVAQVTSKYDGIMPLVSVRSGARVSMPGMMDTILNVGIHSENLDEWCDRIGEEAAIDCYKRFVTMYGEVVIGIPRIAFENCASMVDYVKVYEELSGRVPPKTIEKQLAGSIEAVFKSWVSDRAIDYRARHRYKDEWGTAVNIQTMVFGNMNDNSCSGVLFSRNPDIGDCKIYGDWLPNAQGEEVVAGTRNTKPISDLVDWNHGIATELFVFAEALEENYKDMQDIEFTVQDGELYILQTRSGLRSARASFKIAYDMYKEKLISKEEAIKRVTGKQYLALKKSVIDPSFDVDPIMVGIPAAGGIVSGVAVFSSEEAIKCKKPCILVTKETTPDDFSGIVASVGLLTKIGGVTSHAAVVARGMDRTCVVGCTDLTFTEVGACVIDHSGTGIVPGTRLTLDGATGRVWIDGEVPVIEGSIDSHVYEMISWALENDESMLSVTPENVPNEGPVCIDVSRSLKTIKTLTAAIKTAKTSGASGILDFGATEDIPGDDREFLSFFLTQGRLYSHGNKVMRIIEKTLIKPVWTKKMKKAWALNLPIGTDPTLIEILRGRGWRVVTLVDSFKSALSSDGYVTISDSFFGILEKENMDFYDIAKLLHEAGREMKQLPKTITKDRLMFDVLGG